MGVRKGGGYASWSILIARKTWRDEGEVGCGRYRGRRVQRWTMLVVIADAAPGGWIRTNDLIQPRSTTKRVKMQTRIIIILGSAIHMLCLSIEQREEGRYQLRQQQQQQARRQQQSPPSIVLARPIPSLDRSAWLLIL